MSARRCPASGKAAYGSYGDALEALIRLDGEDLLRGPIGSVYQCASCDGWHVSSRKFVVVKKRGRGKARKKFVERIS